MQYLTREERLIPLEKMMNTRDLGGYETQMGKYTKVKKYVRAASPAQATRKDLETLKDYGVRVVIDLRSDFEIQKEENPFASMEDIEFYHIDLFDDAKAELVPTHIKNYKSLSGLYIYLIETMKAPLKEVFDVFLNHPYETVLFHCSAGKDRTGVVSALLLDLAGCYEQDIVKDYSETYENNRLINESLSQSLDPEYKEFLLSAPTYMEDFIDYLREHYGSSGAYLMKLGYSEEEVNDLEEMFIL